MLSFYCTMIEAWLCDTERMRATGMLEATVTNRIPSRIGSIQIYDLHVKVMQLTSPESRICASVLCNQYARPPRSYHRGLTIAVST
jgi:hypothetical protein